ncbi:myelin-associated glycoprotein isoform X2 [Oryzias melastigma]|uniref:myelin-associated glycoprotein isoform X2 n=1 Tax=Oryzias melastigma TaxID=30732 RepID=UPI00168D8E0A|nr:myelin-associated glycoprotein isoform X2 [Oryzias melastigma]
MYVNMMTTIMLLFAPVFSGPARCPNPAELLIEAPGSLEALAGTCLQIPCTFKTIDGRKVNTTDKTDGVWIKNDPKFGRNPRNVVYNSSRVDNTFPMTFIGNLGQTNCTTILDNVQEDYEDKYYFRVEDSAITATASCHPVQITVKDSAWSPTIEIPADLKEEESVTVTCSAYTPCPQSPPELTWNLQTDSQRKIEKYTNGSFTTKIQKTITLSDTHHGFTIKCSAKYQNEKIAETEQTLNVSRRIIIAQYIRFGVNHRRNRRSHPTHLFGFSHLVVEV